MKYHVLDETQHGIHYVALLNAKTASSWLGFLGFCVISSSVTVHRLCQCSQDNRTRACVLVLWILLGHDWILHGVSPVWAFLGDAAKHL